jgi:hypothetical protein
MSEEQNPQEQAYVLPDIPQHIQDLVNEYKAEVLKPWEWDQKDIGVSGLDEWSASNGASWYYMDRPIGGIYEGKEYRWHTFNGRGMNPGEIAIFVSWREPDLVTYGPQAFESGFAFGYAGRPKLTVRPVVTLNYYIHPENGWHPVGIDELMLDSMMGESGRYSDEDRSEMMAALDSLAAIKYTCEPDEVQEVFKTWASFGRWLYNAQKAKPKYKPRMQDSSFALSKTKIEKLVFGQQKGSIVTPEMYDGRDLFADMGRLKAQTRFQVTDSSLDLDSLSTERRMQTLATPEEEFWLSTALSVWLDNPDVREIPGADILKKAGYSNPCGCTAIKRKDGSTGHFKKAAPAWTAAARSLNNLTQRGLLVETSGENRTYKGKRVVRSIENRRWLDAHMSVIETEDGIVDFTLTLQNDMSRGESPSPFFDYAKDKGETWIFPSDAFKLPFSVSLEVRYAAMYIYRQAVSSGVSDAVLFDTMLPQLDLDGMSSSALGRFRSSLGKVLDEWRGRNPKIVKSWSWKRQGKKVVGVIVHANLKYPEQMRELREGA